MQLPWRFIRNPAHDRSEVWLPTATQWLVAASALGFLAPRIIASGCRASGFLPELTVEAVKSGGALSVEGLRAWQWWQPLTCLFLHENAWSAVLSLLFLHLAGRHLELVVGRRHLFALYALGGLLGSMGQLGWHALEDGSPEVMGASSAVVAVFIAFACTMPELDVAPRLAFCRGVRVKHLAIGTVLASAALMVANPGGRLRAQTDLAGWVVGALAGALYMRQLGFGRRLPNRGEFAPVVSDTPEGWSSKPSPNTAAPSSVEVSLTSSRREVATIAAAGGLVVPRFTERERRMTAREYITEQIDPILDKILLHGLGSLTDDERRVLAKGREKVGEKNSESGRRRAEGGEGGIQ